MFQFLSNFDFLSNEVVKLELIEKNSGDAEIIPYYFYSIFNMHGDAVGKISIRIGHNNHSYYNGNIGFEVNKEHRGFNYSLHATRLVMQVATAHNMEHIYITCQESNAASRRIITKLGAIEQEIVKIPVDCFFYRDGIEDYVIHLLQL